MCGICALIFKAGNEYMIAPDLTRLQHRGPDKLGKHDFPISKEWQASLYGCVLHLRGQLTPQPLIDDHGNVLLWNGEVFGGIEISNSENDGEILLKLLQSCDTFSRTLDVISSIKGPWAMIYWQKCTQTLWFGRDVFGRRSLLWHFPQHDEDCFSLSSVAIPGIQDWQEVPANGIYALKSSPNLTVPLNIAWIPWHHNPECQPGIKELQETYQNSHVNFTQGDGYLKSCLNVFNKALPPPADATDGSQQSGVSKNCDSVETVNLTSPKKEDLLENVSNQMSILKHADIEIQKLAEQLINVLRMAVKTRVENQQRLCHACLLERNRKSFDNAVNKCTKESKEDTHSESKADEYDHSDLEGQRTDTHASGFENTNANTLKHSNVTTELSQKTSDDDVNQAKPQQLLSCASPSDTVHLPLDTFHLTSDTHLHSDSVTSDLSSSLPPPVSRCSHAHLAVLFSGGIDSMVLAALADRYVPEDEPIDLLNVAFEQKQKQAVQKKSKQGKQKSEGQDNDFDPYNVPDRVTGRQGVLELNRNRKWNFVEINVTLEQLQELRTSRVSSLVYPLQTVLDDSIGCAIWCAARGQGVIGDPAGSDDVPYTSTARVVLVGMGADEQFAGYSRHRAKFNTFGWRGLVEEIDMEIKRISSRNLGRDDRIITDHGKEARFPFLDEDVVSYLNTLPVWKKANLSLPRGLGEKLLLRVAAVQLGLTASALLPKRAIQFGSRIAKMENRKENASDICQRLAID